MSRAVAARFLVGALLAAVLVSGRFAFARAASLEDMLAGQLVPSAAPALLGPITEVGRVGWECKPEQMAAAHRVRDAGLPSVSASP
jgi:hypothetical protein